MTAESREAMPVADRDERLVGFRSLRDAAADGEYGVLERGST
jgi:hypothetical protein